MNANSFAPKTQEGIKKQSWHQLDCLAANKLKVEKDSEKLKRWFASQNEEWQAERKDRFSARLNQRR